MFKKLIRILTSVFLVALVVIALVFVPFEASSDIVETSFVAEYSSDIAQNN